MFAHQKTDEQKDVQCSLIKIARKHRPTETVIEHKNNK